MSGDNRESVGVIAEAAMPGWVPKAIAIFWGGAAALWVVYTLFESLSGFLVVIMISFFFSFALEPAVNLLERQGVKRSIGTIIMFVLALMFVLGFGYIVGTVLAEQLLGLVDDAPDLIDDLEIWLQDNIDQSISLDAARDSVLQDDGLGDDITSMANNVVSIGATLISYVFDAFTVALFTYYLTADGPRLRQTVFSRLKPHRQRRVIAIWDLAIQKTGGYIISRTLLAMLSAFVTWIAFSIIGVPFPLALALWVGVVSQFIPVVGVYIAGALPIGLTLIESPTSALWAFIFLLTYQQIENYLIGPRIDSKTLKIHPAISFGSVIAGATVLGPVGALLALPAAATAQGIISATGERYEIDAKITKAGNERRGRTGNISTLPKRDDLHEDSEDEGEDQPEQPSVEEE